MNVIKDWKFYSTKKHLKLYIVTNDENGNPKGKIFNLVPDPVDDKDIKEILEIINQVPTEGEAGQVLTKYGEGDKAYAFLDVLAVPPGGTTGQVLMKYSDEDGQYRWADLT